MSLPASQRRALGIIEGRLRAADPHLASMFAIFARLSSGEPVPVEPLGFRRGLWRQRPRLAACALVLIPVMFLALVVACALTGGPSRPRTCEGDYPALGSSPLMRSACLLTADTNAAQAPTLRTRPRDGAGRPVCLAFALPRRSGRRWACYKRTRDGGPVADRAPRA
jgi:hypothetical protein